MFSRGDEYFSGHVSTFLGTVGLVFHVNSRGSAFDKHFSEFHDGGETAVTGVGVGDDGTEKVYVRCLCAFFGGHVHSRGTLFSVVEELCHEQVFDLRTSVSEKTSLKMSGGGKIPEQGAC